MSTPKHHLARASALALALSATFASSTALAVSPPKPAQAKQSAPADILVLDYSGLEGVSDFVNKELSPEMKRAIGTRGALVIWAKTLETPGNDMNYCMAWTGFTLVQAPDSAGVRMPRYPGR